MSSGGSSETGGGVVLVSGGGVVLVSGGGVVPVSGGGVVPVSGGGVELLPPPGRVVDPGRSERPDGPGWFGVPGGGGGRTVVVGVPSGPTLTTVVGADVDGSSPASATPVTVIVSVPGTPLPGINWAPPAGAVPCAGGPPASLTPPPTSSATPAKAVATTSPLTASIA
ncbi:hypothetical protein SAMN05216266_1056 [Amycolatopsis marina]|uniref:Uncharacterized protein n=1 Tax=Amycolatopsis marina TaxID=490629 RepID=A0A1I0YHJ0_9PSEU|nr:hypothetical protein SAMN05216266_1056 [Amycolatopsis marina]